MKKAFRAFISFDIEGISGVSSWQEIQNNSSSLNTMRRIATDEVNASIKGILSVYERPDEILVCDSHAGGENLLIDKLVRGVHLVRGSPRQYYMIEGINKRFDILFFIGYHAMAGTQAGGMDHTYSSSIIYRIRINGKDVGETEINAAVAGYYGVPLGLVTGDDRLIKEVKKFFGKNIETVITKYGISRFAAKCRHPLDVQEEISQKACRAVKKAHRLKPFLFKKPLRAEFTLINSVMGDLTEPIPGITRVSARKLNYRAKNILDLYRVIRMICNLARAT